MSLSKKYVRAIGSPLFTAVHSAVMGHDEVSVYKILPFLKAYNHAPDILSSAIWLAALNGRKDLAWAIVEHGGDEQYLYNGLLIYEAGRGDEEEVRGLLALRADPADEGCACLRDAMVNNHYDVAILLLAKGASFEGMTELNYDYVVKKIMHEGTEYGAMQQLFGQLIDAEIAKDTSPEGGAYDDRYLS